MRCAGNNFGQMVGVGPFRPVSVAPTLFQVHSCPTNFKGWERMLPDLEHDLLFYKPRSLVQSGHSPEQRSAE